MKILQIPPPFIAYVRALYRILYWKDLKWQKTVGEKYYQGFSITGYCQFFITSGRRILNLQVN